MATVIPTSFPPVSQFSWNYGSSALAFLETVEPDQPKKKKSKEKSKKKSKDRKPEWNLRTTVPAPVGRSTSKGRPIPEPRPGRGKLSALPHRGTTPTLHTQHPMLVSPNLNATAPSTAPSLLDRRLHQALSSGHQAPLAPNATAWTSHSSVPPPRGAARPLHSTHPKEGKVKSLTTTAAPTPQQTRNPAEKRRNPSATTTTSPPQVEYPTPTTTSKTSPPSPLPPPPTISSPPAMNNEIASTETSMIDISPDAGPAEQKLLDQTKAQATFEGEKLSAQMHEMIEAREQAAADERKMRRHRDVQETFDKALDRLQLAEVKERNVLNEFETTQYLSITSGLLLIEENLSRRYLELAEIRSFRVYRREWLFAEEIVNRSLLKAIEHQSRRRVVATFASTVTSYDVMTQQSLVLAVQEGNFRKQVVSVEQKAWNVVLALALLHEHQLQERAKIEQQGSRALRDIQVQYVDTAMRLWDCSTLQEEEIAHRGCLGLAEDKRWHLLMKQHDMCMEEEEARHDIHLLEAQERRKHRAWRAEIWLVVKYSVDLLEEEKHKRTWISLLEEDEWNNMNRLHVLMLTEHEARFTLWRMQMHTWHHNVGLKMTEVWKVFDHRSGFEAEEKGTRLYIEDREEESRIQLYQTHFIVFEESVQRNDLMQMQQRFRDSFRSSRSHGWSLLLAKRECQLKERDDRTALVSGQTREWVWLMYIFDLTTDMEDGRVDLAVQEAQDRIKLHAEEQRLFDAYVTLVQDRHGLEKEEEDCRTELIRQQLMEFYSIIVNITTVHKIMDLLQAEGNERLSIQQTQRMTCVQLFAQQEFFQLEKQEFCEDEIEIRKHIWQQQLVQRFWLDCNIQFELQERQDRYNILHDEDVLIGAITEAAEAEKALVLSQPQYIFAFHGIPSQIVMPQLDYKTIMLALRGLQQREVEQRLSIMLHEEHLRKDVASYERGDWEQSQRYAFATRKTLEMVVKIQSWWRMLVARKLTTERKMWIDFMRSQEDEEWTASLHDLIDQTQQSGQFNSSNTFGNQRLRMNGTGQPQLYSHPHPQYPVVPLNPNHANMRSQSPQGPKQVASSMYHNQQQQQHHHLASVQQQAKAGPQPSQQFHTSPQRQHHPDAQAYPTYPTATQQQQHYQSAAFPDKGGSVYTTHNTLPMSQLMAGPPQHQYLPNHQQLQQQQHQHGLQFNVTNPYAMSPGYDASGAFNQTNGTTGTTATSATTTTTGGTNSYYPHPQQQQQSLFQMDAATAAALQYQQLQQQQQQQQQQAGLGQLDMQTLQQLQSQQQQQQLGFGVIPNTHSMLQPQLPQLYLTPDGQIVTGTTVHQPQQQQIVYQPQQQY